MVFVLSNKKKPLNPVCKAEARILLKSKKAVIHSYRPFVIRLKKPVNIASSAYTIKIDPGAKHTGIAIVDKDNNAVHLSQVEHKAHHVSKKLKIRAGARKERRQRKTRYRKARFLNRRKPKGWLPPSIRSNIDNIVHWVTKYQKYIKLVKIIVEDNIFSPVQYHYSYLTKDRVCVYCGQPAKEKDHIIPKSRGGDNTKINLVWSCKKCNREKSNKLMKDFSESHIYLIPDRNNVKEHSFMNISRRTLLYKLSTILPIETYTGVQTHENRNTFGIRDIKEHFIDALMIGENLVNANIKTLDVWVIESIGRGNRYVCKLSKGRRLPPKKTINVFGYNNLDIVKANKDIGDYKGVYYGYINTRARGDFTVYNSKVQVNVSYKKCERVQPNNGYRIYCERI